MPRRSSHFSHWPAVYSKGMAVQSSISKVQARNDEAVDYYLGCRGSQQTSYTGYIVKVIVRCGFTCLAIVIVSSSTMPMSRTCGLDCTAIAPTRITAGLGWQVLTVVILMALVLLSFSASVCSVRHVFTSVIHRDMRPAYDVECSSCPLGNSTYNCVSSAYM